MTRRTVFTETFTHFARSWLDLARPKAGVLLPLSKDLQVALCLDLRRCRAARRRRPLALGRARHLIAPCVDREAAAAVPLGREARSFLGYVLENLRTLARRVSLRWPPLPRPNRLPLLGAVSAGTCCPRPGLLRLCPDAKRADRHAVFLSRSREPQPPHIGNCGVMLCRGVCLTRMSRPRTLHCLRARPCHR